MSNINYIACQFLNCGALDINFLDELMEAYNIDLWIDDIRMNYWIVDNINILIYEAYNEIKNMFIEENEDEIKALWFEPENFEIWNEYEIYTNYMASSLEFNDNKLAEIYEDWRKR